MGLLLIMEWRWVAEKVVVKRRREEAGRCGPLPVTKRKKRLWIADSKLEIVLKYERFSLLL
jgi:hypothetical protein